jgi:hypothetical protein
MFPFDRCVACFPLPFSGFRGRPLREPCGSPPSSVLWGRKTARPSVRAPPVDPRGPRTSQPAAIREETESSLGFLDNPCGSMPRARDSGDPGTTSQYRSLPDAAFR